VKPSWHWGHKMCAETMALNMRHNYLQTWDFFNLTTHLCCCWFIYPCCHYVLYYAFIIDATNNFVYVVVHSKRLVTVGKLFSWCPFHFISTMFFAAVCWNRTLISLHILAIYWFPYYIGLDTTITYYELNLRIILSYGSSS
jgi:hypothetical protein